ncbi:MAG TPA: magnesium transporter CorA family protein [Chloroflexota bacterium]|nr:magnesium transporter CorA family protein [Chloroflexota bacterium]
MIRSLYWGRGDGASFRHPLRSDGESACASDWRAWQRNGGLMWIDLERPDRRQMDAIAQVFDLHQVAINVVMAERSRPKLMTFDHYFILTMYSPKPLPVTSARLARLTTLDRVEEIELIVGERFLVTVHEGPLPGLEGVWRDHEQADATPVDMSEVVHELMDGVVDLFFPVLDIMVDRVEEIQETAFVGHGEQLDKDQVRELFSLKKQLNNLHRILDPQRAAIAVLARQELPFFRAEGASFQDIFDHAVRQSDNLAVYVDLLVSARESYLVRVSNVLANAAKILMTLTLFLSIPAFMFTLYGMNFDHIPEAALPIGHGLPVLLTLLADSALFVYFNRKLKLFA